MQKLQGMFHDQNKMRDLGIREYYYKSRIKHQGQIYHISKDRSKSNINEMIQFFVTFPDLVRTST